MKRAFTLVETLVVIGVVAVLAGIIFPVTIAAARRAQHTDCAERLHGLGVAVTLYANDHDGWVPPATTSEFFYAWMKPALSTELQASPAVLRAAMAPYVKNDEIWFCPADKERGKDVLWLGMSHLLTSYHFLPRSDGDWHKWPPRMQLGRDRLSSAPEGAEDVPLFCDAVGIPFIDSDPQIAPGDHKARSNHPDDWVNAIRHDLSLKRGPASYWMGTQE